MKINLCIRKYSKLILLMPLLYLGGCGTTNYDKILKDKSEQLDPYDISVKNYHDRHDKRTDRPTNYSNNQRTYNPNGSGQFPSLGRF